MSSANSRVIIPAIATALGTGIQRFFVPLTLRPFTIKSSRGTLMKTPARLFAASLIVAGLILSGSFQNQTTIATTQPSRVKALVGGTLIDGYGGRPLRNSVVIIEGQRIKSVGQVGTLSVPKDAEVISTEGMTVMPGLWDMHVHLMI